MKESAWIKNPKQGYVRVKCDQYFVNRKAWIKVMISGKTWVMSQLILNEENMISYVK